MSIATLSYVDVIKLTNPVFASGTLMFEMAANATPGVGESIGAAISAEVTTGDVPQFVMVQNVSGADAYLRTANFDASDTGKGILLSNGDSFPMPWLGPDMWLETTGACLIVCFY